MLTPQFAQAAPQQVLLVRYTRILLPAQFCFFAGGLFGAAQMATAAGPAARCGVALERLDSRQNQCAMPPCATLNRAASRPLATTYA